MEVIIRGRYGQDFLPGADEKYFKLLENDIRIRLELNGNDIVLFDVLDENT